MSVCMNALYSEIDRLREENECYKKALRDVWDTGHNEDCIFCGLKDRTVKEALGETEETP